MSQDSAKESRRRQQARRSFLKTLVIGLWLKIKKLGLRWVLSLVREPFWYIYLSHCSVRATGNVAMLRLRIGAALAEGDLAKGTSDAAKDSIQ